MKHVFFSYIGTLVLLFVFTYGFIDPNIRLTDSVFFDTVTTPLTVLVRQYRHAAGTVFAAILMSLYGWYIVILKNPGLFVPDIRRFSKYLIALALFLAFSYPALTHDIFNYVTTAKLTFHHRENPYIVMPVEIPNEPYLAFTRAANKVALYGPVWILMTALPYIAGGGNIWQTLITFKLLNAASYLLMVLLIYRVTGSVRNMIFFALNPLVIIETLVSGHNDIHMMLMAVFGLLLWRKDRILYKMAGFTSLFASWWIKGATLVLLPVLAASKLPWERVLVLSYWLLAVVFFILTPIREELYPWYAVWLVSISAFLPADRYRNIIGFTIVLTFALELRHIPYMVMGHYGGQGPILRAVLTAFPVGIFLLWNRLRGKKV
jgi:hypothetical protein